MTGCNDSDAALSLAGQDTPVSEFVPAVIDLLQRITSVEPTITTDEHQGVSLTSPIVFPDGIGEGQVVAELFIYRENARLDLRLEHNRVFANGDGSSTGRRCYLNDYIASTKLEANDGQLPAEFVRGVVAGVAAARDAVRRHNRRAVVPWNEIHVAAVEPEPTAA